MKKFASVIMLIFYFAFTSGVMVNLHYCMNRFDSIQLGSSRSDVCGKCGMHTEESDGCCHDELKFFKIDDDQQTSTVDYSFTQFALAVVHNETPVEDVIVPAPLPLCQSHSPPLSGHDICVRNSVFRI